jgi:hypothetical protein
MDRLVCLLEDAECMVFQVAYRQSAVRTVRVAFDCPKQLHEKRVRVRCVSRECYQCIAARSLENLLGVVHRLPTAQSRIRCDDKLVTAELYATKESCQERHSDTPQNRKSVA